ncbi:hypothetical protein EDF36_2645 [Rathayibacter sp. PhB152]|nr:hypothetical protein EDF36_2645 [Rathayibacter sp. PhB152]
MIEPAGNRTAYDSATADLMVAEAADIVRAAGFAGAHLVIIGGLVPSLLIPVVEDGGEPHVGTTDIDLCVSLAFVDGETEQYDRLEQVLLDRGFSSAEASFRWVRESEPRITLEFFCPAGADRPAGRVYRPRKSENPTAKHNMGGRLSALALDAGELLVGDTESVLRRVELPSGRGMIDIRLLVTGPLAFLVAKSEALQNRDKPKDAYDIVWLLESWPEGPAAAAAVWSERPAFSPEVRERLVQIGHQFANENTFGARSYAVFISEPEGRLRAARRAVGAVREFLDALPEAD